MIGIVVAGHGDLADALVSTALSVMSAPNCICAVAVLPEDETSDYEERMRTAIASLDPHDQLLILTDMFGGTPSNVGMTLHLPGKVEVLTGVNLPMVLKALNLVRSEEGLLTVAHKVKAAGVNSVAVATDVLTGGSADSDISRGQV